MRSSLMPAPRAACDRAHRGLDLRRRRDVEVLERAGRTAPGVCGAVTSWIGALQRRRRPSCATVARRCRWPCCSADWPRRRRPGGRSSRRSRGSSRCRAARSCAGRRSRRRCPSPPSLSAAAWRQSHHAAERDDRDVVALAHDVGLAERDRVGLLGHVALDRRTAPCARRRSPGRRRGSPGSAGPWPRRRSTAATTFRPGMWVKIG